MKEIGKVFDFYGKKIKIVQDKLSDDPYYICDICHFSGNCETVGSECRVFEIENNLNCADGYHYEEVKE